MPPKPEVDSHPVMRMPMVADFYRGPDGALRSKEQVKHLFDTACQMRAKAIANEIHDPVRYGWEPPIWKACDALLGLPLFDTAFGKRIQDRFGWTWEEWCVRFRHSLGIKKALRSLMIPGPNSGGKTEWAAKRTNQLALHFDNREMWCLSQTEKMSIDVQQKILHKYLPVELRQKDLRSKTEYITFKKQTGFGMSSYVLPNGTRVAMHYYKQEEDSFEGSRLKWCWCDERVPPEMMETLEGRVADQDGWFVNTFTPKKGWTGTVVVYMTGAEIVRSCDAFLLPLDGGEPDEVRSFGFQSLEERNRAWADSPKRTVVDDVLTWLEPKTWIDVEGVRKVDEVEMVTGNQPAVPAGRSFECSPRIMKCRSDIRGICFFQPMDNPFGNPPSVWEMWKDNNRKTIKERLYGWAEKTFSGQFPSFNKDLHTMSRATILALPGSNYMVIDPTPGARPYFMLWLKICRESIYIYREWPQRQHPGVDTVPFGDWAVASGHKDGINDGKPGPASDPVDMGFEDYVREIARLEGWDPQGAIDQYTEIVEQEREERDEMYRHTHKVSMIEAQYGSSGGFPESAGEYEGECIVERCIDSRAASAPKQENDRVASLFETYCDYGLNLSLATGMPVSDRVGYINNRFKNQTLYIAAECENVIYSLENWLWQDGIKGATKDPIDCLGYGVCKAIPNAEEWYDLDEEGER